MIKSAEEMQSHLVEKAGQDAEFRSQLLSDPKSVFTQEFGIEIPDSINVHVHQNDLQHVHISLPPQSEMTEEQLEAVSAGLCCCGV